MKLREIITQPQAQLKVSLEAELKTMGYKPRVEDGFIYCKGTVPVLLIAHLDTVHKKPVKTICYSSDGMILMSPEGIGGDDRAGVHMVLEVAKTHRCHILFCEDEEKGGIGADKFASSNITPEINYIVEFDRRGGNDAVFYDCDNREFVDFVESFGFIEEFGSFSDISVVAPALGIAAVNISAGYHNEHTTHEYIDMREVNHNINRVARMVSTSTVQYEYIEAKRYKFSYYKGGKYTYKFDDSDDESIDEFTEFQVKRLMEIYEPHYIKTPKHDMKECDGDFMIDEKGLVYEYNWDIGYAVELDGYQAFRSLGLPAVFNDELASEYKVVSEEEAWKIEEFLYLN